jgi:Zn-dependent protease with chaperone function
VNRDEFDALVRRREAEAQAQPRAFLLRTAALALGGFAYILGVLALMLAVMAGLGLLVIAAPNALSFKLALFLGLGAGAVAWAILRALWVRFPAPAGLPVTAAEAPALAAAVTELQQRLGAPAFHRMLVVPEFNAAVVQVPRLGVFGWHRNYLLLGLPLMQALTPAEFRAVIAHEFGHLAGGHGRFGNWLYRLRRTWERTFEEILRRQPGKAAAPLTWFIRRFWPAFNARAFVLGRANEYEADAVAARLAGAEQLAAGLVRINLGAAALEQDFWPGLDRLAGVQPQPPDDVFERMGAALGAPGGPEAVRRLQGCLRVPTGNADTHPGLADRLRALGHPADAAQPGPLPPPVSPAASAAANLLGPALPGLVRRLDEDWAGHVAEAWEARHAAKARIQAGLAEAADDDAPPTPERLWEKASALAELGDHAAVAPVLDGLLALRPDHAGANFLRGRLLLERDDAGGVAHLERAMAADPEAVPPACNLLYGFYARTGQHDRLRALEQRVDAHQELEQAALAERQALSPQDRYLPHGLDEEQLAALRRGFAAEPAVAAVDLARKEVRHFAERPCFALAVRIRIAWWQPRSATADQKLLQRLLDALPLPGVTQAFVPEQNLKALGRAVAAVPGARVYERAR